MKSVSNAYWSGKNSPNNDCSVAGKGNRRINGFSAQRHCIDMKKKAVIVSGYFNPKLKGHLEYFNNANATADELFVIVNNDHQRALKDSNEFQGEEERMIIVSNIKAVDDAILSVDEDRTVCATLEKIAKEYADSCELAFANGGDQNNDRITERPICAKKWILS